MNANKRKYEQSHMYVVRRRRTNKTFAFIRVHLRTIAFVYLLQGVW